MRTFRLGCLSLLTVFSGCEAFQKGMSQAKAAGQLVHACAGEAVAGSAAYVPGTGKAPMAAARLGERGKYEAAGRVLTMDTPQPAAVEEAQLVVCIDAPTTVELGVCAYDTVQKVAFVPVPGTRSEGPTYARTRADQPIRVVEAATGKVIGSDVLAGAEPPACDAALIGGPDEAYFRGQPVGDYAIGQWAKTFVAAH